MPNLYIHMIRETYGVQELPINIVDTMRLAYIINTGVDHSLKGWGSSEYGSDISIGEDIIREYRKVYKIKDYSMIPSSILDPYACMDVALTKCLVMKYEPIVNSTSELWNKYEHMLIPVTVDMSKNGMKIDLEYINSHAKSLKRELYSINQEIFDIVGKGIKPGSPHELGKYFYDRMGGTV